MPSIMTRKAAHSRSQATVLDCMLTTSALANIKLGLFCFGFVFLCAVVIRPIQNGPSRFSHSLWVGTSFTISVIILTVSDASRNASRLDHSLLVMGCFTIIATLLLWTAAVLDKADRHDAPAREKRPLTRTYGA